ncbi:MAG: hypothetical protein A2067_05635 [Deltaproteobacteria bacterium GWB2_42_7]|nr:MAG: hypothetical protein A2067_05635 [Deltaproteobacteria bacterium GWB2_42_7]
MIFGETGKLPVRRDGGHFCDEALPLYPPFLGTDLKSVPTGGQGEDTVKSKNAPTTKYGRQIASL